RLAPLGRPISSRIFAPLLSARGVLASLVAAGLVAFLPALASFLGAGLALPRLAAFWALGAPFFGVAPFFEEVVSGATIALCSATVAVCSAMAAMFSVVAASAVFMVVDPFCAWRMTIEHSRWVVRQEKSGYHPGECGRDERMAM